MRDSIIKKTKTWIKAHRNVKRVILWVVRLLGPVFHVINVFALPRYVNFFIDWYRFLRSGGKAAILDFHPCIHDKTATTSIDSHYFYQALWAFKKILDSNTKHHVDVGSKVEFVGLLTTITDVTFIDIRPLELKLDRYTGKKGSILALPFNDSSVSSLSSLHVIEHIGLGRYGDPIDPNGTKKACRELQRIMVPGGNLYLSLPIGKPRVCFNAHRIHTAEQILSYFSSLKARIKTRLQERCANKSLVFYNKKAIRKRLAALEGSEFVAAFRRRLASRGLSLTQKKKGELHVFLAFVLNNWESVLPKALEPFGKVTSFEWRSLGFNDLSSDWLNQRDAMNAVILESLYNAHKKTN